MADNLRAFPVGFRVLDSNGDPVAGAKLKIYDAGTSDQRTSYSDAALTTPISWPVTADSAGLVPDCYLPTGAWKVDITTSADVLVAPADNITGALDTSSFLTGSVSATSPTSYKTSAYTVVADDMGELFILNPTGGSFTTSLVSAAAVTNGDLLTFKYGGTANVATIDPSGSQTIDGEASLTLTKYGEAVTLVSDGANWNIAGRANGVGQNERLEITDRLTAPPTNPVAGARYILNGTGTGAWSGFSEHDVLEADGLGGWIQHTPADGWLAYLVDETLLLQFRTNAWVDLSNITAPTQTTLPSARYSYTQPQNTGPGTATLSAWTKYPLNNEETDPDGLGVLATSQVTLEAGTYVANVSVMASASDTTMFRLYNTDDSEVLGQSPTVLFSNTAANRGVISFPAIFTIAAAKVIELQYYVSAGAANALGVLQNIEVERYGEVIFTKVDAQQGPQGAQGLQGPEGFAGYEFTYSTTTAMADPGAGEIRFNNGTLASITSIAIDATSAATGNPDVSADLATWQGDRVKIYKVGAPENFIVFDINTATDNGGWLQYDGSIIASAGSLADTNSVAVSPEPRGEAGASGTALPLLPMKFNTATSGDPGWGKILGNSATLSSITSVNVSDDDRLGADVSAEVGSWDDEGAPANRGRLYIIDVADQTNKAIFKVTGSVTDNITYQTYSVTHIDSSGAFSSDVNVSVTFIPAGPAGAGLSDIVDDTTPQLGGQLDVNGQAIGDGTLELLTFTEDASAVNHVNIENEATGSGPIVSAAGDDTNIDLLLEGKGTGTVKVDGVSSASFLTDAIEFVIDGGGSAITTGVKGYLEVPFACTITAVTTLADQSGSIVVDVWKDTYANYPPTDVDSITASAPPTISIATKAQDSTLTGWTTSISAGDILGFNVDSITTCELVTVSLKVTRT